MKITAALDKTPCSLVDINISEETEVSVFYPEDGGKRFLRKYGKFLLD
jgi:hypothetical protein